MLLKDKVLLVTGASAGIGRAVAIEAARQGADVAINYFDATDAAANDTVSAIIAMLFFSPSTPSAGPWCSGILPPMKPSSFATSGRAPVA